MDSDGFWWILMDSEWGVSVAKQASDKQSIKAADTAGSNNAVRGRRRSEQASGKQSLSAVPPAISHSSILSRKQAISNPSY